MVGLFGTMREGRHFAALLLSLGLIQIAGYYLAGALVNGPGPLAIPQPDTPLYCQAAARVAAGHPFSFSAGSAACTGTTSILYPFVLAVPHLLGFRDAALVTAGFWLNAFFYLVFLGGWGLFVWRRFADPALRCVAAAALALFPQTAYCALAQSDIGFWLAASGLFAATLSTRRALLYGPILLLAPWIRPEGMICVAAFATVTLCNPRRRAADGLVAALGLASVAGVFALNYALTGHAQFASVAHKGHFAQEIFSIAVERTFDDLMAIGRSFLFGQPVSMPRTVYALPFLGAALVWLGIFVHDWQVPSSRRNAEGRALSRPASGGPRSVATATGEGRAPSRPAGVWADAILLLAALGGLLSVAQSGWQNTNVDRYLAWIMPVFTLFMCEGMVWTWRKLRAHSAAAPLAIALPLLFSAVSCLAFWALYNASSEDSEHLPAFGRDLDKILPRNVSYGVTGWCGLAYTLPDRRCAHLAGIYSPEFSAKTLLGNLEILKNDPATRFDYWIFAGDDKFPAGLKEAQGRQLAVGPDGLEARLANWKIFDWGAAPHAAGLSNLTCVARVDVGHEADEARFAYEIVPRYHVRPFDAIGRVEKLAGTNAFDVGRIVFGEDEMTLPLTPGRDVTFVMRTLARAKFSARSALYPPTTLDFAYADPLELHIEIDGVEACHSHARLNAEGFTDAVFHIPGRAITHSPCRLSLHGDHVTFGYWFYQ